MGQKQHVVGKDSAALAVAQAQAAYAPAVGTLTLESGVALQDTTNIPSKVCIDIKGKAAGSVKIGPSNAVADELLVVEVAASTKQLVTVPLPPGWWVKVTLSEGAIVKATQLPGQ